MNRPKLILFLLVCVLAVSVIVAWFRMPKQKSIDRLTFQQGAAVFQHRSNQKNREVELQRDLLEQKFTKVVVKKNIFKLPGEERGAAMVGTRQRLHSIPPPPPPPPPTPQEIARTQLAAFTVIGSYIKKNTRIVFLAKGEEILTVRIGNHLMPGYTVVAINDEQLKLRSDDGRHELILNLCISENL